MTRTDMQNAVVVALANVANYKQADVMTKDAFIIARVNANASLSDVDIRIHWNWFELGWRAARIFYIEVARNG